MLRGLYRSRCEQIGGIASAVRGLALDEVVDLILLAHEDEFVVAMHDQFLGAVLELLAWALRPTTVTPYLSCTCTSSMLRPTAYRGVWTLTTVYGPSISM